MLALKIPPPVQMLIAAAAMWLCAEYLPALAFTLPGAGVIATTLAVAGAALLSAGGYQFWRAGTTINPMKPARATRLVTNGVHRFSRNPMYLGELLLLTGWALHLGNALSLAGAPLFALSLTFLQIMPEERILQDKFGAEYTRYRQRVRRWLGSKTLN